MSKLFIGKFVVSLSQCALQLSSASRSRSAKDSLFLEAQRAHVFDEKILLRKETRKPGLKPLRSAFRAWSPTSHKQTIGLRLTAYLRSQSQLQTRISIVLQVEQSKSHPDQQHGHGCHPANKAAEPLNSA